MFVDIDSLTTQEWKILQQWEAWPYPGDHAFWQSMTSGLSFTQRLEALNLSQDDALEIFAISPFQYDKWLKQGPPTKIIEQFSLLEARIYVKLGEWGGYCRDSVDCFNVVGIPCYETIADYNACDEETSKAFPFLALYPKNGIWQMIAA